MPPGNYAQLYVNKLGRARYTFSFRIFDRLGQRIGGQDDVLPARNKAEAKKVARLIASIEMKKWNLSHVSIFIDGVQLI